MAKKFFFCVLLVVVIVLSGALSVAAQSPGEIFVDPSRSPVGNEDGTQASPYSTRKEGEAYAQSLQSGGYIYVKQQDGTWKQDTFIPPVKSGSYGTPLPRIIIYILLAVLAVVLSLAGWQFLRRANQLQGSPKLWHKS